MSEFFSISGEQNVNDEEDEPACGIIDLSDEDPDAAVSYLDELARRRDANGWPEFILCDARMIELRAAGDVPVATRIENILLRAVLRHQPENVGVVSGNLEFTDGFLYVLPAKFSEHDVRAAVDVAPLLGIKVSRSIGPAVMERIENTDLSGRLF